MATVTSRAIELSGPAIRAALAQQSPRDVRQFETELRDALTRAAEDLDLERPRAVLVRWHALATMAANPLTTEEQAQLDRARSGDFTGLATRDENGNWATL